MTELLERPAQTNPSTLTHLTDLTVLACSPHTHTVRCWWNVGLGGWVCPPSRREPT